jgi:hypothetical protein
MRNPGRMMMAIIRKPLKFGKEVTRGMEFLEECFAAVVGITRAHLRLDTR